MPSRADLMSTALTGPRSGDMLRVAWLRLVPQGSPPTLGRLHETGTLELVDVIVHPHLLSINQSPVWNRRNLRRRNGSEWRGYRAGVGQDPERCQRAKQDYLD